jgi:hypothetical protein
MPWGDVALPPEVLVSLDDDPHPASATSASDPHAAAAASRTDVCCVRMPTVLVRRW